MPGSSPGMTNYLYRRLRHTPAHPAARIAPGLCPKSPPSENRGRGECRVLAAPAASRGENKNHTSVVTARTTGITRHSRTRMVLTVSFVLSPETGLIASVTGVMRKHHRQLDASIGASGPHDFAVRGRLHKSHSAVLVPVPPKLERRRISVARLIDTAASTASLGPT